MASIMNVIVNVALTVGLTYNQKAPTSESSFSTYDLENKLTLNYITIRNNAAKTSNVGVRETAKANPKWWPQTVINGSVTSNPGPRTSLSVRTISCPYDWVKNPWEFYGDVLVASDTYGWTRLHNFILLNKPQNSHIPLIPYGSRTGSLRGPFGTRTTN